MTTKLLKARAVKLKVKPKPWNKKQAITEYQKNFKIPFDMKEDGIDLREMSKNFANEIAPLEDIHKAIKVVLGPKYDIAVTPHDPSGGAVITYQTTTLDPRFAYVEWKDLYLWSIFQRDVAPNHIEKIYKEFNPTCISVPCAIRITLKDGNTIYCVWDGHHTCQVCRLKGYTKFPIWFIDIDNVPLSEIEAAGFGDTDEERIKFGVWLAGTNMRNINGKMKRPLSPYDDFLVGVETRDAQCVSMMNILKKNNCVPKRHATCSGAFTQIKSGIECYELADTYGNKGQYWDRALKFHRTLWPMAPLTLEVFRPMSMLYHRAAVEGITLNAAFDKELGELFVSHFGTSESVQESLKESFERAYHTPGSLTGQIPDHNKERVLNGIINFYNQKSKKKAILPTPTCQWKI
jgi:hypothetical protein